ncbi:heterokaryon incompatibility protein-domain-containing protein, partial [Trametes meyenii]
MVRLLNTRTGEFKEFDNPEEIPYAILSHVWSPKPGGEQSYQDLLELQTQVRAQRLPSEEVLSRASAKIRNACAYALDDGFEWIWIDSSCIDKTSSAELSESINSMYTWYSLAAVCYAYLQDVSNDGDPRAPGSQFRACRWFTRGWTLQELIAPRIVIFCSAEWETLGTKDSLGITIQEITGVGADVLVHSRPLSSVSVSSRMSWAADRITRRKEHEAYCLMGIFGVNMPTIYGEGRRAFVRLQEQILKEIPDQSIFAWEDTDAFTGANSSSSRIDTLFAESPADFA